MRKLMTNARQSAMNFNWW